MEIILKAEQFVKNHFKDNLSAIYTYHNFAHTLRVVAAVDEISQSETLTENEREALRLAALFHDTGYSDGEENHEHRSASIFREFIEHEGLSVETAALTENLILITEFIKKPANRLEYIIRDADTSHFASDDFIKISEKLRKEWAAQGKEYSDLAWLEGNLMMLTQKHLFYTDYARKNWQAKKDENIALVRQKIAELKSGHQQRPDGAKMEKPKKDKKERTERGVETMFKITANNHTRLSQIADSKANILLSVNAIIISISLSTLIPKLDSPGNAHLVFPTFVLLMFSVASIIFAILSTRPKVTSGSFTREGIKQRNVNLLFFGNFHKMPYEEYEWAMNEVMKDPEYLYNSMIKDLYYLGLVLKRKYTLLRVTYNIFMLGIILSFIAFVFAFLSIRA